MRGGRRPLFGYRIRSGRVEVDPPAAAIVCAVLAVPTLRRTGLGSHLVHLLDPTRSAVAVWNLAVRIRRRALWYRTGKPRADLPPDPRLILSGRAPIPR